MSTSFGERSGGPWFAHLPHYALLGIQDCSGKVACARLELYICPT